MSLHTLQELTPASVLIFIKHHFCRANLLIVNTLVNCFFEFEGGQKAGAFKARGALNTLLTLKEKNQLPERVIAYSSGNHAQAVAWAAQILGIRATIFIPQFASSIKIAATKNYGAEVVLTRERQEAEDLAHALAKQHFLLPPYDHDDVIAGQGTAAFEAWAEEGGFDAVFAPCGGGGLISGTYLATRLFSNQAEVCAAEPLLANDAAQAYKTGVITRFFDTPMTLADGARTLSVSARTLQYIRLINHFYEIEEEDIARWTQWITHLLKVSIEPTAALGMAAAFKWLQNDQTGRKILVILSGGNTDPTVYFKIWKTDYLEHFPLLT